ncbi:MAG: C40 family peptidase [Prevotella sp.]
MKNHSTRLIKAITIMSLLLLPVMGGSAFAHNKEKAKAETVTKEESLIDRLLDKAKSYLGTPYRRSGKSPKGFDCSGFTSWVYKKFGVSLGCSSRAQYTQGEKICRKEIQPGDLVFFSGTRGGKTIGHVGIVYKVSDSGSFKFIHSSSSGGVKISSINEQYYSSRFKGARRMMT